MAASPEEHLLNHLRDVHALEVHSIRQYERAASRKDEQTTAVYEQHLQQSQAHEQKIGELVEARGHEPSPLEDKTLRGRAIGLRQLADIALNTPAKMAMNLFALEHLEIAGYELLVEIAKAADDEEIAGAAEEILKEEREAAEAIEGTFDHAVELLTESSGDDDLLLGHLRDTHALERQSLLLLELATEELIDDDQVKEPYEHHLEETRGHEEQIAGRIEARNAKPSAVKDLHLGVAKSALQDLSAKPPDVHAKMAMNVFCVEHLEIAAHELLVRIAESEGDDETVEAAKGILEEERAAAQAIGEGFPRAVELMVESDASYESVQAAERPMEAEPAG